MLFEWGEVRGASGYTLEIAEDEAFKTPVLARNLPVERARLEIPVIGPVWWRVRAVGASGVSGAWSPARRFEVMAPPLAAGVRAVTITPAAVPGGESALGLVTLDEPAPPGGATVLLAAGGPAMVKMPARLLIPGGKSDVSFTVETAPVRAEAGIRIAAASRGEQRFAALTLSPPRPVARLMSVSVHPAVLAAGGAAVGTVAIARPASSAVTVAISSNDPARVLVPASVRVPAGASSANFTVRTARGNTPGSPIISASLGGTVSTARLTLTGGASIGGLAAPAQHGPRLDESVSSDAPVEFRWSPIFGSTTYTLEVDDDAGFGSPLSRTVVAPSVWIGPLPPGTAWWRVRANDEYGAPGRWSAVRALRVQ